MNSTRSRINRIDLCKLQATFFGHEMRGERLEHLVTTGMIIERAEGETASTGVGWTNKEAQIRMSDRSAESDMG